MSSEKLVFTYEDSGEQVEFYILEQTKLNGNTYLLVADSEEDDAECLILKDTSAPEDEDSLYEITEDEVELEAVLKVFEEHENGEMPIEFYLDKIVSKEEFETMYK